MKLCAAGGTEFAKVSTGAEVRMYKIIVSSILLITLAQPALGESPQFGSYRAPHVP